jgi:ketosteroid isomerase-like protein
VEGVLEFYTEDLVYIDPNTRGAIESSQAMRRYLTIGFSSWETNWSVRSEHPLKDANGEAVRWHATFKRRGQKEKVEIDGMDLVIYEGNRIKRNEVYFDRSLLIPLMSK